MLNVPMVAISQRRTPYDQLRENANNNKKLLITVAESI